MSEENTYAQITRRAEEYLKAHSHIDANSAAPSKQVVDFVLKLVRQGDLNVDVTAGTILSYISKAANKDNTSKIVSGGSWGGYWYDGTANTLKPKEFDKEDIKDERGKEVTFLERDLYPLIELWLFSVKGYVAKDVSTVKAGRKWGNPDIVGINRVDLFGSVEIQLSSVEVKLSEAGWEQFIFESISHKRFSNRSWYCYRVSDERSPLPKGMEYYAERYRIGVIQIVLSDEEMAKLKTIGGEPIEFIDRVRERVPAVYDEVPLIEKKELIDRTGIQLTLKF